MPSPIAIRCPPDHIHDYQVGGDYLLTLERFWKWYEGLMHGIFLA